MNTLNWKGRMAPSRAPCRKIGGLAGTAFIAVLTLIAVPLSAQAQALTCWETTLNLQAVQNPDAIDQVVYRWSTNQPAGLVNAAALVDISMELFAGGNPIYVDTVLVNGVSQSLAGTSRDGELFWDFDLATATLRQMRNATPATFSASTGTQYHVADNLSIPADNMVRVGRYTDGSLDFVEPEQLDTQTTTMAVPCDTDAVSEPQEIDQEQSDGCEGETTMFCGGCLVVGDPCAETVTVQCDGIESILSPPEPELDPTDFGAALACRPDGDVLAVGAPLKDYVDPGMGTVADSGEVYFFDTATWDLFIHEPPDALDDGKLYDNKVEDFGGAQADELFGCSLTWTDGVAGGKSGLTAVACGADGVGPFAGTTSGEAYFMSANQDAIEYGLLAALIAAVLAGEILPAIVDALSSFGGIIDAIGESANSGSYRVALGVPGADGGKGIVLLVDSESILPDRVEIIENPSGTLGRFGESVALSSNGDVVVGAPDENGTGAAHVFFVDDTSVTWVQTFDGDQPGERFGAEMELSDDRTVLLVGSPLHDGTEPDTGKVTQFVSRTQNGMFESVNTLWGSVGDGKFGSSIALSGTAFAVGAPADDVGVIDAIVTLYQMPDGDGDGVIDGVDNCRADANADQSDIDEDGAGDICDASTTIVPAGTSISSDLEVTSGESLVLGANSVLSGNLKCTDNNIVSLQAGVQISGNVENCGAVIIAGSNVVINGNFEVDGGSVIVEKDASASFAGNIKAFVVSLGVAGALSVDGNLEVYSSLTVAAGASIDVAGNLTCDSGVIAAVNPSATISVAGNSECTL